MHENFETGLKNILSIDMDYAYSPSISSYDDHIVGSRISLKEQEDINRNLRLPKPEINPYKVSYLRTLLKEKLLHSAPVFFITHHHDILKHLPDCPYRLYNFDHHHDIFYPGWHQINELDEGNWLHHVNTLYFREYIWIRNLDSEWIETLDGITFPVSVINPEPSLAGLPIFDSAVICSSPHWTGTTDFEIIREMLFQD